MQAKNKREIRGGAAIALAAAACLAASLAGRAEDAGVPYPDGYRRWTFLHGSMVPPTFEAFGKQGCEKPCTSGMFYFYANDKAMEGLRTGSYPDGAMLTEEMLEFQTDAKGTGKEGQRRLTGVMVKDSQRYSATGGWGFGIFDEGSRTNKLDGAARDRCFRCHASRKDKDYVFAEHRER